MLRLDDTIILLHGLGRTSRSMHALALNFRGEGHQVCNINYPSRKHPVAELVAYISPIIAEQSEQSAGRVHFVTHSLGGILVRAYLAEQSLPNLGRVVMLSPPNQGSELAQILRRNPFFKLVTGPAGQDLGTGANSVPNQLGPVDFELGIIMGKKSFVPFMSLIFHGPNDGRVAVARAKVSGQQDFLVVEQDHAVIMRSPEVIEQTLFFLQYGQFLHNDR